MTEVEKIIRRVRFAVCNDLDSRQHLCTSCIHRLEHLIDCGQYHLNIHPCERDLNVPQFAEEPKMITEDNGSGFDVIECDHYKSFREDETFAKQVYCAWIKSDEWRKIARKTLIDRGLVCECCGTAKNLAIHHITYAHLLEEDLYPDDLIVLCSSCHSKAHGTDINRSELKEQIKKHIETIRNEELEKIHKQEVRIRLSCYLPDIFKESLLETWDRLDEIRDLLFECEDDKFKELFDERSSLTKRLFSYHDKFLERTKFLYPNSEATQRLLEYEWGEATYGRQENVH